MDFKRYFKEDFFYDLKAGFITSIVALPLAIAFAIASGVNPIMGIYTAIIAGILGSSIGGSRFSITGPTGAMAVIILSTVNKYGVEGLLVAGFLAGLIQIILGLIKIGRFVKFIPFPIISGFTAGIGVIIFLGQFNNALGLSIPSKEHLWETLLEIFYNINSFNSLAVIITLFTIMCLVVLPIIFSRLRYLKNIPISIIPLIVSTAAVILLSLSVPQVGAIPSELPSFSLIKINLELIEAVLPASLTIAILGIIEALLCAVVCDGMTNTKHNSDKEIISQGVCNTVLPFFGGIPCTAAIARSAVNIREKARTRISGVIHGIFILLTLVMFSQLAQYIPKAFLSGVLMVVSFKMINIHEFKTIFKISYSETIVLLITFFLTIFTDLVFAVEVGMILAIVLMFIRLTSIVDIKNMDDYGPTGEINALVYKNPQLAEVVSIYTLHGPFFFGAMNVFDKKVTEHMDVKKPILVLKMKYVPFIDSTGVVRLKEIIKERHKQNKIVFLSDVNKEVINTLLRDEEFSQLMKKEYIFGKTKEALSYVEKNIHLFFLGEMKK